jgi:hypothetical protein
VLCEERLDVALKIDSIRVEAGCEQRESKKGREEQAHDGSPRVTLQTDCFLQIFERPPGLSGRFCCGSSDFPRAILAAVSSSILKEAAANKLAEPGSERVSDSVKDPLAVLAALEYAGLQQKAQVFGDVGLSGAGEFNDFAHVPRGIADGLEDAQACGFAEGLKNRGNPHELVWGEGG